MASNKSTPLKYSWTFWYFKKPSGAKWSEFEQNLIQLGTCQTVEEFWALYCHLARPTNLSHGAEYFVFKTGVKPMWEDEHNKEGGKWSVRLKKGSCARSWENLLLALIGEQFGVSAGEDICGAAVSVKPHEDIISLWNRSASNRDATTRIRDVMKEVLDIPINGALEYKPHNVSLDHLLSFQSKHSSASSPTAASSSSNESEPSS